MRSPPFQRYPGERESPVFRASLQLVLELGRRPGGDAGQVPLVQKGPGFFDREAEALDEDACGVEGLIVTALARDCRRNLGQIGGRAAQPVVMAFPRYGAGRASRDVLRAHARRGFGPVA